MYEFIFSLSLFVYEIRFFIRQAKKEELCMIQKLSSFPFFNRSPVHKGD